MHEKCRNKMFISSVFINYVVCFKSILFLLVINIYGKFISIVLQKTLKHFLHLQLSETRLF